jgi:hypothetical protein
VLIVPIDEGSEVNIKLLQPWNAFAPILEIVAGIDKEDKAVQP